ncbi:MAG: carbohydrate ABC transporter permease [Treponema sp.]|jgi:putative aldouronate transport system permease protein|nr:carbohydrate ABC transporter permease [Treponema sp.]
MMNNTILKPVSIRRSTGERFFSIFNYLFFTLFTLICILPFYYLFINTISDNDLTRRGLITFIPRGIHLNNYVQVFKLRGLGQAAFVSVARTILGSALTVAGSAFVGYLVTKREMWGRSFWYRFIIVTMYFNAGIVPWYMNMVLLHLTNNFLAYIIPGIVAPFNIILVKTYVESIPSSLEESASIDGAGTLRVFVSIIWPLITPILATIAIFSAVGNWNAFTDTLFLMTREELFTLQFLLYRYLNEANYLASIMRSGTTTAVTAAQALSPRTIQMTISMVVVLPILLIYPFMQRFFVKGIMIGAVKG